MKRFFLIMTIALTALTTTGCSKSDEMSQRDITQTAFADSLGGDYSSLHWWRTAVKINVHITTDQPVELWLLSSEKKGVLYDYAKANATGTYTLTAPQGLADTVYVRHLYRQELGSEAITLTGKPEEEISLSFPKAAKGATAKPYTMDKGSGKPRTMGKEGEETPRPASLCGNSLHGDAQYYEFDETQMGDYYTMMDIVRSNDDAKLDLHLNCNYELASNGPFYITWVDGHEESQLSRTLGYYYHSPGTYYDIQYVDLSETHKWDYLDGLSKVQYKLGKNDTVDGHIFEAGVWYDANFDLRDNYGSTRSKNMDRIGDNAYNSQEVFNRQMYNVVGIRGISFKIDVPEGMRIGFYLRSEEQKYPAQWRVLHDLGVRPNPDSQSQFKGTCFSPEAMNLDGTHRSFILDHTEVIWMGMEDVVEGGDHDCNDVIFGVVSDLQILMPDIVSPDLIITDDYTSILPWTIAYEDVNREADFDFNDAVIKLTPDFDKEKVCVSVLAAGATERMYLYYDGPDGHVCLGEMHELLGQKGEPRKINTTQAVAAIPAVEVDCVDWPADYTMANDAKRFTIEIRRGTCDDCTDVIALPSSPGEMPEALLIAGEWKWPQEGIHIKEAYNTFPAWGRDATRKEQWKWYSAPEEETVVGGE